MIRIPTLRLGEEYQSLDVTEVKDCRTGEVLAEVSSANGGIVRKDLNFKIQQGREALKKFTVEELIGMSKKQRTYSEQLLVGITSLLGLC